VQDETVINWKSLTHPGSGLELWSGRNLLHRWIKLKAGVPDFKEKNHQGIPTSSVVSSNLTQTTEIMKILRVKFKDDPASCSGSTPQISR